MQSSNNAPEPSIIYQRRQNLVFFPNRRTMEIRVPLCKDPSASYKMMLTWKFLLHSSGGSKGGTSHGCLPLYSLQPMAKHERNQAKSLKPAAS